MSPLEKSIAVCPGSYDPITNGHLDVIRRAANLYDEVIVAVVNRSVRKSGALFGIEERLRFIQQATADLERVRAEPFSNLAASLVEDASVVGGLALAIAHPITFLCLLAGFAILLVWLLPKLLRLALTPFRRMARNRQKS